MTETSEGTTKRTTLYDWHMGRNPRIVTFGGYDLPVHYTMGIVAEHNHTRESASFFDVSHMGQIVLRGEKAIEKFAGLVPSDVKNLKAGQMRYTALLNDWGGMRDDLIMVKPEVGDDLWLVVNAGTKENDLAILHDVMDTQDAEMQERDLIALQGPKAEFVLRNYISDLDKMSFMQARWTNIRGMPVILMRSGYTGEDGFEISVPREFCEKIATLLMMHEEVKVAGLGARDTLRLEAGLCLYGHDLNEKTTPIEANLKWIVSKERLSHGDFIGASILEEQFSNGPERVRVGIMIDERAPAREGTEIHDTEGNKIGVVTSGTFSPALNTPIAMGYVNPDFTEEDTPVKIAVRKSMIAAHICPLPFVPHRYYKAKK